MPEFNGISEPHELRLNEEELEEVIKCKYLFIRYLDGGRGKPQVE